MTGETYEVVKPKHQQRADIIHDIKALIGRYFTTRTHYKDCVLIEFFSDPLREEYISGWRVDKQFYKRDIERLFTAGSGQRESVQSAMADGQPWRTGIGNERRKK